MAGDEVVATHLDELRLVDRALLLGCWAASAEPTSRRRSDRGGQVAFERRGLIRTDHRIGLRDRLDQRLRVVVRRCGIQRVGRADLADLSEVHNHDAVRHVLYDGEVVGNEDQREPVGLLHVLEQVQDLRLHRYVERRHRFVADDDLGVHHDGAGDADALTLAARELVRLTRTGLIRIDADRLEDLSDLGLLFGLRAPLPDVQRLGHDVHDLAARVQRGDRILEDHLHPRAKLTDLRRRQLREVLPLQHDRARRRRRQLHDRPPGRRLPAP